MKTWLDGSGRIELPDVVQLKLGVKPGDELALDEENGRWFIKSAKPSSGSRKSRRSAGVRDIAPASESPCMVPPPLDTDTDDLNWEELDYKPVPLKRAGQVAIQLEHRGTLKPMPHHFEEE